MASGIKIVCFGKIKERHIQEGINEFLKRLRPFCKINLIEVKDSVKEETIKLQKYLGHQTFIMDETGMQISSEEFADLIKKSAQENKEIIFIIGGPDGISQEMKSKSKSISLSRMTFTHDMARLFLIEQIYRSHMIINNRKYHR